MKTEIQNAQSDESQSVAPETAGPIISVAATTDTQSGCDIEKLENPIQLAIQPPPSPVPLRLRRVLDEIIDKDQLPPVPLPLVPGYRILRELGRGGMGVVYEAIDLDLQRKVAIKVVLAGVHSSADARVRFRREAQAVARLQHPNIVQLFDTGTVDDVPYLAFEFVDGCSLSKYIHADNCSEREVVRCVSALANAISYAHAQGILHRDLKPSNILLTREGVPKIADFGLAKIIGCDEQAAVNRDLSRDQALGTPGYMAPEQIGTQKETLGPEVDVWGLGAILYEFLSLSPPFRGATSEETLRRSLLDDPIPLRKYRQNISRDLEVICLKCLAKKTADRYRSAAELESDLQRFVDGKPILARAVSRWERSVKWCRRHPLATTYITAAIVLLFALSSGGWLIASRERVHVADLQRERLEKNRFFERMLGDLRRLKDLSDALAKSDLTENLPQGNYRREIQEERLAIYGESLAFDSRDPLVLRDKANTYERMADVLRDLDREDEALESQREGVRLHEQLAAENPVDHVQICDYAQALDRLGLMLKNSGKTLEANQYQNDAVKFARRAIAIEPECASCQSTLGTSLNNVATQILDAHTDGADELETARVMLLEAIESQEKALRLKPSIVFRRFLRNHHGALTETLLRQGNYGEAAVHARTLPQFFPEQYRDYERAAAFLRRCSRATAADSFLDPEERKSVADSLTQEANELEREAAALRQSSQPRPN